MVAKSTSVGFVRCSNTLLCNCELALTDSTTSAKTWPVTEVWADAHEKVLTKTISIAIREKEKVFITDRY
jgi:hypothetical protein